MPLSNKIMSSNSNKLAQSLEGIGDILVYETKRQKNKLVFDGLQKISDSIRKMINIRQANPAKFERLVASEEFLGLYKKDAIEARVRFAFDPERYPIGFSTALNQIVRVYEAAVSSQNQEISKFAVYHLNWILAALSSQKNNEWFLEQILGKLSEISRISVQHRDSSVYGATIYWYTDIVFNRLQASGDFQVAYLELFDRYFFPIVQYIVSENQTPVFHSLVSSLVDGIHVPTYRQGSIRSYGALVWLNDFQKLKQLDAEHHFQQRVNELADSESDLNTQAKLETWLKKFDELRAIVEQDLTEDQKIEARKMEAELRDFATTQFKYLNLLEIVFAIGAYCMFKQRYAYLNYLWTYKQPPDSDASWGGTDIIPQTLDGVLQFYFRNGLFQRRFDTWEDHHGTEIYYKQYFLLLIARILQNFRADSEGKFSQIENYKLTDLPIDTLSNLERSMDEFINLATDLKRAGNMLAELGFDAPKLDELFDSKLVPFLRKLKEEAGSQITAKHRAGKVSQRKIEEFKKETSKSFFEQAVLRGIFIIHFKAYEDKTKEKTASEQERFGINVVDDKAAFFETWHVHYMNWGLNYGGNIASWENAYLLDELAKDCKVIAKGSLETILATFANLEDITILTTNIVSWQFFEDSKNFKPKWHAGTRQLDVKGFGGWYDYRGQSIPIFETYGQSTEERILILNKAKIGKLVQLSPLSEGEDEKSVEGIFFIDIQAYSENSGLMETMLKNPPDWLKQIGDEQRQHEYLEARVRIRILERFEYVKPTDFEGYKILLKEN